MKRSMAGCGQMTDVIQLRCRDESLVPEGVPVHFREVPDVPTGASPGVEKTRVDRDRNEGVTVGVTGETTRSLFGRRENGVPET